MDGLTTVLVVFAPPRKRKRSATTFMPIWIVSVAQAQEGRISLIPLPAQCSMAMANQWVMRTRTVETATFWAPRRETFRPITYRHRREEILRQAKLQPVTATTELSRWTSSAAE